MDFRVICTKFNFLFISSAMFHFSLFTLNLLLLICSFPWKFFFNIIDTKFFHLSVSLKLFILPSFVQEQGNRFLANKFPGFLPSVFTGNRTCVWPIFFFQYFETISPFSLNLANSWWESGYNSYLSFSFTCKCYLFSCYPQEFFFFSLLLYSRPIFLLTLFIYTSHRFQIPCLLKLKLTWFNLCPHTWWVWGHPLEHGQPAKGHSYKDNWLSFL